MTDNIASELEQHEHIITVDSWPTGTANAGPEEYGIRHTDDISYKTIVSLLNTLLEKNANSAFFLEASTDTPLHDYDFIATVHRHGWSPLIHDVLSSLPDITTFGMDWSPENICELYDNTPYLDMIDPGPLSIWIENEHNDYDAALDAFQNELERTFNDQPASFPQYTLDVASADSDHCHFTITFDRP